MLLNFKYSFVIFLIGGFFGTSTATIDLGIFDTSNCSKFFVSTLFEYGCPSPEGPFSQSFCDEHCQCIHNAIWGQCTARTANDPQGTGAGDQMCRCYYESTPAPPPGHTTMTPQQCATNFETGIFLLAPSVCSLQSQKEYGFCTADCVCAHGFATGYCTANWDRCICTNGAVPSNASPGNPFAALLG